MKKIISLLCIFAVIFTSCMFVSAYSWTSSTHGNECDDSVAETRNTVYYYLSEHTDLNKAAICGILGNIWAECCFETTECYGSYNGLCQWGGSRWNACQSYCENNGYSIYSATGQTGYLVYELKNTYPNTYNALLSVPNSEDGVYEAERIFRINYEGCGEQAATRRQNAAINYWNKLPDINGDNEVIIKETTTKKEEPKTEVYEEKTTVPQEESTTKKIITEKETETKEKIKEEKTETFYVIEEKPVNKKEKMENVFDSISEIFEQVMMPTESVLPVDTEIAVS